ncbi:MULTISPECIES: SDR family oxidoreductase [unclassified Duganella]|uniref:SDR family oxidoreductase n=1 Tax=unclassified Duganella TaxID=2636909 RepID=UPI00088A69F3|nr:MULTISPECIES: SDR family oxidoreductase [unclassified Duganella]SDH60186.1 Nucleoside-diphosphate-sugar epimerase [Duganella sp. OV458]SDJ42906.1 Nucleoside-diphosphate-sugar epimerase [Duganella sp. OV510]
MKVLVLGATGLIGGHAVQALRAAGCSVTGLSRRRPAGERDWLEAEFGNLTDARDWLPLLAGYDAVVNCVGIIRETRAGDFDRLHRAAPVAMFAACEQLGVRRVVQVSALGSAPDAATGYWRSKGAAEADLMARSGLQPAIIRPSLVYGDEGASSIMFRMLATLPVLMMPMAHGAKVQPIHVDDLVAIIVKLVTAQEAPPRELATVGPRAGSMAAYLGDLRQGMQAPAGLVLDLPMPVARLVARVAALAPSSALTPESLLMLEQSADGGNTANAAPAAALLGRPLRDPASFAQPAQRIDAVWQWASVLITLAMATLWLWTAAVSWFGWPHEESRAWLAACGIPAFAQEPMLLAASLTDAAIGVLLLLRPRRWLWAAQLALVGGYTVIMSLFLPFFWLHPFGPLSKNLPLLALMFLMWRASR